MRILAITFLFTFSFAFVRGQDTTRSLEREILSYKNVDGEIIGAARRMLLDRVRAGDAAKVAEVLAFLDQRYDGTRYLPLYPGERFLLAFWGHQYAPVLQVERLESIDSLKVQQYILPPRDLLFDDVRMYTRSHRTAARAPIMASALDEHSSAFLLLLLDDLILDRQDTTGRRILNDDADEYLARFPGSPYAGYVRREFRYVLRASDWGYAMDIGGGAWYVRGNMTQYFRDEGGLTIGGDIGRRNLLAGLDAVLYLRMSLGAATEIKSSFQHDGTWPAGLKVSLMTLEATIGAIALDGTIAQVTPFGGIVVNMFGPSEQEQNRFGTGELTLGMASYAFGLNVDWKISSMNEIFGGKAAQSYWFVRTRLSYSAPFSSPESRFGGNIVSLTVSFGGFSRSLYRDL